MTIRWSSSLQSRCRLTGENLSPCDLIQTPKYAEFNVQWILDFIRTKILIV